MYDLFFGQYTALFTIPAIVGTVFFLLRMGLLKAMAARAAGERDREKRERDGIQGAARAAAENELARLRRQLAAEKKG